MSGADGRAVPFGEEGSSARIMGVGGHGSRRGPWEAARAEASVNCWKILSRMKGCWSEENYLCNSR